MAVDVFMPKMSDHMESGEIVEWLVDEGDLVQEGQPIVEIVTDKVTAEIEAPSSGVLKGIRMGAEKGMHIPVGETIAFIANEGEQVPVLLPLMQAEEQSRDMQTPDVQKGPETEEHQIAVATPVAVQTAGKYGIDLDKVARSVPGRKVQKEDVLAYRKQQAAQTMPSGRVKASPAARRSARELGVDISLVPGTGPDSLVRESDVVSFREHSIAAPGIANAGEAEWLELTPIQKATGERMVLSATTVPQFSLSLSAEMENILQVREKLMDRVEAETGRRLSVTTLLLKIVADALRRYPRVNAAYERGHIKLFKEVNIGIAIGTDEGLIAPVVKKADLKSVIQINREMKTFEEKARTMKFNVEDLEGAHFTISNLGMYGIEHFNAIINPPQSSILAVGKILKTPVGTENNSIILKKLMNITLSVDHRCLDGVQGAQFLALIKQSIENPEMVITGGENAS
jgi:pyruvate dehydrogenase E2 component (dihydrolipoamide acetyltransferase)